MKTPATRADVETLMQATFPPGRPQRSAAYQAGVRAKLCMAFLGERLACTYAQGTAEFDAFFAGVDEGYHSAQTLMVGKV